MMAAWEQAKHDRYRLWHRVVEEYTRRKLTLQSDKLVAISGIARWFEKKVILDPKPDSDLEPRSYFAGVWQQNLMADLLWTACYNTASDTRHAANYRAPSWSWASMDGPVEYTSGRMACARPETAAACILSASPAEQRRRLL
jgi:hypothetical protein